MKKNKIYLSVLLVIIIVMGAFILKNNGYSSSNSEPKKEVAEKEVKKETEEIPWYLTLVGPENELDLRRDIQLKTLSNGQKVDERIYDELGKMLNDAKAEEMDLIICSSYRTQEKQESLFNAEVSKNINKGYSKSEAEKQAAKWVARPKTSEHQLGLAIDIVSTQYQHLDEKQADTSEQKWLMEHCHEYGFILRYPKEKTEITGVNYEPWHYRYVGKEAAKEIKEKNLTLEEYINSYYKL